MKMYISFRIAPGFAALAAALFLSACDPGTDLISPSAGLAKRYNAELHAASVCSGTGCAAPVGYGPRAASVITHYRARKQAGLQPQP